MAELSWLRLQTSVHPISPIWVARLSQDLQRPSHLITSLGTSRWSSAKPDAELFRWCSGPLDLRGKPKTAVRPARDTDV